MPWARFEDRFPSNRKIRKLDDAAFRLYVSAICWSSENLTDGVIEADDLRLVADVADPHASVAVLVRLGLWEPQAANAVPHAGPHASVAVPHAGPHASVAVPHAGPQISGWIIHDYFEFNPTAEQVKADRALKTARQQRWRQGRRAADDQPNVDASVGGLQTRLETLPRPVPSRPVLPSEVTTPASAPPSTDQTPPAKPSKPKRAPILEPEAWERFWSIYPRKKDKGAAEKAWNAALRAGTDAKVILDGAEFYVLDCRTKEAQYIKYPASWLNARGWQDEADPTPQAPSAIGAPSVAAAMQPRPFSEIRHEFAPRQQSEPSQFDFGDAFGRIPE